METEINDDILPPLYCNPGDFGQNQLFLDWILEKSCSDMMGNTRFQLFSLPALLYELSHSLEEEERTPFAAKTYDRPLSPLCPPPLC